MALLREEYPGIHFQIYSGNSEDVLDRIVNTAETSDLCFRPFNPLIEAGWTSCFHDGKAAGTLLLMNASGENFF